jgi:hypothetical protein
MIEGREEKGRKVIVRERERTSDNGWGLARVIDYIQHYLITFNPKCMDAADFSGHVCVDFLHS